MPENQYTLQCMTNQKIYNFSGVFFFPSNDKKFLIKNPKYNF